MTKPSDTEHVIFFLFDQLILLIVRFYSICLLNYHLYLQTLRWALVQSHALNMFMPMSYDLACCSITLV